MSKIIKRKPQEYAGFSAFKDDVNNGTAAVFKWYIETDFPNLEYFYHVPKQLQVYRTEQQLAISPEIRNRFTTFLGTEKPQIVVAFSLGSILSFSYFDLYGVPDYIHTLVTVQAALPNNFQFSHSQVNQRLEEKSLRWINYYCPWDMLLPFVMVVDKAIPSGLAGSKNKFAQNKMFPLRGKWNIHTGSISDPLFRAEVNTLLRP